MKKRKTSRKIGLLKQKKEPFIPPQMLTPEEIEALRAMRESAQRLMELHEFMTSGEIEASKAKIRESAKMLMELH